MPPAVIKQPRHLTEQISACSVTYIELVCPAGHTRLFQEQMESLPYVSLPHTQEIPLLILEFNGRYLSLSSLSFPISLLCLPRQLFPL